MAAYWISNTDSHHPRLLFVFRQQLWTQNDEGQKAVPTPGTDAAL